MLKKVLFFTLAIAIAIVSAIGADAAVRGYTLGDADNNNEVEIIDATIIQRILSDMITDPEFGRLMELIRTKINDDDRVIEYGEGDEAVTARQSDIIDFNIGKVIGSMCDRIRENRQNETVREIIPDEAPAIEKTVSRELTQEEYEDMLDDLNNGLYNYNPYAYDQN